jgi:exonuclease III
VIPQAHVPRHVIGRVGSGNMKVSRKISDAIMKKMGYTFDPNEFHMGMNVEMEHQDVTNGNVVKTAKIAATHLTEKPNYYTLLKKYVEKKKDEQLVGPGGAINAAPKPKDVKKMRKALDSEK